MNATLIAVIVIDLLLAYAVAFALFGNFSNLKIAVKFLLMPNAYVITTKQAGKYLLQVYKLMLLLVSIAAIITLEVNYL